jgi:hypothetical protein
MASYEVTTEDQLLIRQHVLELRGKFDIYSLDDEYLDTIEGGLVSGNNNINAESDIRRTLSITLIPRIQDTVKIGDEGIVWLDKKIRFYIGIRGQVSEEYKWYPQGEYVFMHTSSTYDPTTNQLQLECSDMMAMLDGTRNGNLGQLIIEYPAYQDYFSTLWVMQARAEGVDVNNKTALFNWVKQQGDDYQNDLVNSTDPNVTNAVYVLMMNTRLTPAQQEQYMQIIRTVYPNAVLDIYRTVIDNTPYVITAIREFNILREAMETTVGQLAFVKQRNIDEIGEAKGMPGYAKGWDYKAYREEHPEWNRIPFDQNFASGCTVLQIVTTLRDMYENYEAFFDVYGTFCCQLIPSGDDDPVVFDNDYLQDILISENVSLDFTEVKNITEVWGEVLEPDFFANSGVTYTNNTYVARISGYTDEYCNGDLIALKIPAENAVGCYININNFGRVQVYDENYELPLDTVNSQPSLHVGATCVFKIRKKYISSSGDTELKAYYMGEWQPHAIEVLTNGKLGEEYTSTSGVTARKYSKEYYQTIYNCAVVNMLVNDESPFVVQKIGNVLQVINNNNVQSEAIALETAHQENYRACRLTDQIQIVTKICPFADVNQLVEYRPEADEEPHKYLVKTLSHNIESGTTTWGLMRYYRLYLLPDELLDSSEYFTGGR